MEDKLREISNNLEIIRNSQVQSEVKEAIEELLYLFRDVQSTYVDSVGDIPWNSMDNLVNNYKALLNKSSIDREYRLSVYADSIEFINKLKKKIIPKSERVFHFIGSISFVLLIPIIKFFISIMHRSNELNSPVSSLKITNFEFALPLVFYCWIVSYSIKNKIKKIWSSTVTTFATVFILMSNTYGHSFRLIIVCAVIIFIFHLIDSWQRHVNQFELFSYYK